MTCTTKKKSPSRQQRTIMDFVRKHGVVDLDEILDYTMAASKASLQFTIRAMLTKGLIQKLGTELRRGRSRQTFSLASGGQLYYDPRTALPTVSVDKSDPVPPIRVDAIAHREKSVSDFEDLIAHREKSVSDFLPGVPSAGKIANDFDEPEVFLED